MFRKKLEREKELKRVEYKERKREELKEREKEKGETDEKRKSTKEKFLFEIDFTVNSFLKRCKLLLLWSLFFVLCKIYAKNYPKKVSSSEFQFKITSFA